MKDMDEKLKDFARKNFDSRGNRLRKAKFFSRQKKLITPEYDFNTAVQKGLKRCPSRVNKRGNIAIINNRQEIIKWLTKEGFTKFEWAGAGMAAIALRALDKNGDVKIVRIEGSQGNVEGDFQYQRPDFDCVAQAIKIYTRETFKIEVLDEYIVLDELWNGAIASYAFLKAKEAYKSVGGNPNNICGFNAGIDKNGNIKIFDLI